MKPLLTISILLWVFHAFLAAGPQSADSSALPNRANATIADQQSLQQALDYIVLAYDIVDVFVDEDAMNLEHDDNNRKFPVACVLKLTVDDCQAACS